MMTPTVHKLSRAIVFTFVGLLCLCMCSCKKEFSEVQKVQGIAFMPIGDTLTLTIDGNLVKVINLGGGTAIVQQDKKPSKQIGLVNIQKNTQVTGDSNQVGNQVVTKKNKDKSENLGAGAVKIEKPKDQVAIGENIDQEKKETKGIPIWPFILAAVLFVFIRYRKALGIPF